MSIRFGILGIMDHTIASDLMSSYMGTGMYIGEDRLRIVVRYPAEPALSEAACQSLYRSKLDCSGRLEFKPAEIGRFLNTFISSCLNGHIDVGSIGGLIARIILSITFDKLILEKHQKEPKTPKDGISSNFTLNNWPIFSYSVRFEDFINELVDHDYLEDLNAQSNNIVQILNSKQTTSAVDIKCSLAEVSISMKRKINTEVEMAKDRYDNRVPEGLKDGLIAFNTWTAMVRWDEGDSSLEDFLKLCISKRTAIILPPNHPGADLLIPILLPNGRVGFSLKQIKNRVGIDAKTRFYKAGEHLTPKVCFREKWLKEIRDKSIEYMAIYIEVGNDPVPLSSMKDHLKKLKDDYPNHLMLLGFRSMKVSSIDPIKSILDSFCRRQINNMETSSRYTQLKIAEPVAFPGRIHYCNCSTDCSTKRCGCKRSGSDCSEDCGCTLNRIIADSSAQCKNQH